MYKKIRLGSRTWVFHERSINIIQIYPTTNSVHLVLLALLNLFQFNFSPKRTRGTKWRKADDEGGNRPGRKKHGRQPGCGRPLFCCTYPVNPFPINNFCSVQMLFFFFWNVKPSSKSSNTPYTHTHKHTAFSTWNQFVEEGWSRVCMNLLIDLAIFCSQLVTLVSTVLIAHPSGQGGGKLNLIRMYPYWRTEYRWLN